MCKKGILCVTAGECACVLSDVAVPSVEKMRVSSRER